MGRVYESLDGQRNASAPREVRRPAHREATDWGGGVAVADTVYAMVAPQPDASADARAAAQRSMDLRDQGHTLEV